MKFTLFTLWLSATLVVAFDYSPKEIRAMEEGLQNWRDIATNPETLPLEERFETLSLGLRKTSQADTYVYGDRVGTHDQLRKALMEMPGYADYFAKRVRSARERLDAASDIAERGFRMSDLEKEQRSNFQTLALLPSVETVRVLGDFLDDEAGRIPKPATPDPTWKPGPSPNAFYALQALARLPLQSKPLQDRRNHFVIYDEDIGAWRLWFAQVKAGTRTFRFEGDPQEYSLAGPVKEAHAPKTGASEMPSGNAASENEKSSSFPASLVAGAVALLGVALWYATRGKFSKR